MRKPTEDDKVTDAPQTIKNQLRLLPRYSAFGKLLEVTEPDAHAYFTKYDVARDALNDQAAEIERLQHDVSRYMAIASEHATDNERLRAALGIERELAREKVRSLDKILDTVPAVETLSVAELIKRIATGESFSLICNHCGKPWTVTHDCPADEKEKRDG
jgi:hypothetical protein